MPKRSSRPYEQAKFFLGCNVFSFSKTRVTFEQSSKNKFRTPKACFIIKVKLLLLIIKICTVCMKCALRRSHGKFRWKNLCNTD